MTFNPEYLAPAALLTEFFTLHDSSIDRSAPDGRGQYRSAVFVLVGDPRPGYLLRTARAMTALLTAAGHSPSTRVQTIPAFYPASARHQQYCSTHGRKPAKRDLAIVREILTSTRGFTGGDG